MLLRLVFALSLLLNLVLWGLFAAAYISVAALLPWHIVSALLCAVIGQRLLPPRYSEPRLPAILFFIFLGVFIPLFGVAGLACSLLPGLTAAARPAAQSSLRTDLPPLPYKPVSIREHNFSGGGIFDILKRAGDSDKRATAVMATQHMQTRMAVPLLRLALRDSDDDVRLLAYGILDKKENQVNAIINALQAAADTGGSERGNEIKEQLAQQYWEMAYLGLAEGDVRANMLGKAETLLQELIDNGRHTGAAAYLLQGKVLLALDKRLEARRAFQGARLLGVGDAVLAPYLAEIAFAERDYHQVKKQLHALGDTSEQSLKSIVGYWQEVTA